MSQTVLLDPIVSGSIARTGTGTGTLSVDKLTHFTTAQSYTATCIATSPDTVFAIVGADDGPVGIATVGTQFYDDDLKIFLTIQQGPTPFAIGDQFTFAVVNGTDVNQANVDLFDELPQKNFGTGVRGQLKGDHSIRYSDTALSAVGYLQGLKFAAVATGSAGNALTVQTFAPVAAVAATVNFGNLLLTAKSAGTTGNSYTLLVQDGGPSYFTPTVSVSGGAITIVCGLNTATYNDLVAAINGSTPASALVTPSLSGSGSALVTTATSTPLPFTGGAAAYGQSGAETVKVSGNALQLYLTSGVTTKATMVAAFNTVSAATALATIALVGNPTDVLFSPGTLTAFSGGLNRVYTFNQHELTDPTDFHEGNASVKVQGATVQGDLLVAGNSSLSGIQSLSSVNSGPLIDDVQRYINNLIKFGKISLRTADASDLSWSHPTLTFSADIHIDFNDAGTYNSILASNSPLTLADGQSAYVILNPTQTGPVAVVIASEVPTEVHAYRFATRFGDNLILGDNTLIRDGKSAAPGEGGGAGGDIHVQLYDPVDTALPTGASCTIDGVTVTNNMLVLFSNLASGNNEIYKVSGVGTSLVWTAQTLFINGLAPTVGEAVIVEQGSSFAVQRGVFNGTTFSFNDAVRFFTGTDYWELSGLKTTGLVDNTTADLFSVNLLGSENMIIDFMVTRGTAKDTGTLKLTSDGVRVSVSEDGAYLDDSGTSFSAYIDLSNVLHVQYTSAATGTSGVIKYFVRRWSNSAGGPGGIPSYSAAAEATAAAAGVSGDIQFNSSDALGADSAFTWDSTNKILQLNGLNFKGLSAGIPIADNTSTPTTLVSFSGSTFPFSILNYSILRDGIFRVGRLLIACDGTNVAFSDDNVSTDDTGIILSASCVSGSVEIQFVSTATGLDGTFKLSGAQWS